MANDSTTYAPHPPAGELHAPHNASAVAYQDKSSFAAYERRCAGLPEDDGAEEDGALLGSSAVWARYLTQGTAAATRLAMETTEVVVALAARVELLVALVALAALAAPAAALAALAAPAAATAPGRACLG